MRTASAIGYRGAAARRRRFWSALRSIDGPTGATYRAPHAVAPPISGWRVDGNRSEARQNAMARQQSRRGGVKADAASAATAEPARQPSRAASGGRIAKLESERAQLKTELAAANARITELERRQIDLSNRIAWAIDTLHNLLEEPE